MPAIYPYREVTQSDGLLSYGSNIADIVRQAGVMTGKVLKGASRHRAPGRCLTRGAAVAMAVAVAAGGAAGRPQCA